MENKKSILPMVDPHTHILPNMDDGSKDVEESLSLLKMLKEQGVVCVAATSHFYSERVHIHEFLKQRAEAFARLQEKMTDDLPEIRLGAEVTYFSGMSHSDAVQELKIQGTPLLLVEMPFMPWTQGMLNELVELNASKETCVLLAHVERYFSFQRSNIWEFLLQNGILMQSNAEYFLSYFGGKRGIRMMREERLHVIGTDSHRVEGRAPHFDKLQEKLLKCKAEDVMERQNRFYRYFFATEKENVR